MAKTIPGKEEFHETIRYFNKQVLPLPPFPPLLVSGQDETIPLLQTNWLKYSKSSV